METASAERDKAGLRVCILSRKRLGRVTRVTRQAKALSDAGHEVTVVAFQKPVDELVAQTPDVQYIEVDVEPWTRRYVAWWKRREEGRLRRRRAVQRTGHAVLGEPSQRRPGFLRLVSVAWLALLTRSPAQSLGDRIRELLPLAAFQLHAHLVRPFSQYGHTIAFAKQASAALRGRLVDVCQAHDNYALLAADRIARERDALLVYDAVEIAEHRLAVRIGLLERVISRYERLKEKRILKRARAIVTIGDALADWYARRYRVERPLVVRNCRYYWDYTPRKDIRLDCAVDSEPLVVWFGYTYPDQGLETIIEAARYTPQDVHFALLCNVAPRWQPFFDELQARVERLGLENRIHFLPPRDPNDLISYVSGADIGIIPRPTSSLNTYLSMPNKFMEMVMARLPMAISDLADMRNLIEHYEMGAIFDVDNPQDVARVVLEMLEPSRYAALHAGVCRAATELTWENESRTYVALYAELARERDMHALRPKHTVLSRA